MSFCLLELNIELKNSNSDSTSSEEGRGGEGRVRFRPVLTQSLKRARDSVPKADFLHSCHDRKKDAPVPDPSLLVT